MFVRSGQSSGKAWSVQSVEDFQTMRSNMQDLVQEQQSKIRMSDYIRCYIIALHMIVLVPCTCT